MLLPTYSWEGAAVPSDDVLRVVALRARVLDANMHYICKRRAAVAVPASSLRSTLQKTVSPKSHADLTLSITIHIPTCSLLSMRRIFRKLYAYIYVFIYSIYRGHCGMSMCCF